MFDRKSFEESKRQNAAESHKDLELRRLSLDFIKESDKYHYGYQWSWLGVPIIQLPADILATQEIIWATRPDVIIETGVAWGGSIVMYASLMELAGNGRVVGIDATLPDHVRADICKFPFSHRIDLIEGDSTAPAVFEQVRAAVRPDQSVMVLLDSNHTHDHVLAELRLYADLVTPGCFLVVSDTIVEDIPPQAHRPRPWGPGNNPKTALRRFLEEDRRFTRDPYVNDKLLTSYSPDGFLRRIC